MHDRTIRCWSVAACSMRALDHILNPSRVIDEKYRNTTLTLKDGAELSGAIESEDDKNVVIRIDPLAGRPTVVPAVRFVGASLRASPRCPKGC